MQILVTQSDVGLCFIQRHITLHMYYIHAHTAFQLSSGLRALSTTNFLGLLYIWQNNMTYIIIGSYRISTQGHSLLLLVVAAKI